MTETEKPAAKTCKFCSSGVGGRAKKCPHCGEWLTWSLRPYVGQISVVLSILLSAGSLSWQMNSAKRIEEMRSVDQVLGRYAEIDRMIIERPELETAVVGAEDFADVLESVKTEEGRAQIRESEFIAYLLDLMEIEFIMREEYGTYPRGGEFVMDRVLTNPKIRTEWYENGLRNWYSDDFRKYVEGRIGALARR